MKEVLLVGNPNTGKTTLFNTLTLSNEHVGNWHGVTVKEKAKRYKFQGQEINLVDLPGIYSLTPLSFEEKVARDYLLAHKDSLVVNICDASNLQRNLYLTLSLMELGVDVILAVNQIDRKPNYKIDYLRLEKELGIRIVYVNAQDKKSVRKLNEEIVKNASPPRYNLNYLQGFDLSLILPRVNEKEERLKKFYAIKILEDDEYAKTRFGIKEEYGVYEKIVARRYEKIDKVVATCCGERKRVYGQSRLDKILLNKFLALPIFFGLLALVFYLTFFSLGKAMSDGLNALLDGLILSPIGNALENWLGSANWFLSFYQNAIVGGLCSILTFLPQVVLLFFFLSLIEDSGYLARVAFIFEDILGKVGLSGKSVYTLLMGLGCSTSAVLTARNMEDKNAKIKTALLTPYMSCSAKVPIYSVIGGAFFGVNNLWVILGLYLLGMVIAVLMSFIYEKAFLKSKGQSFILEFPPYKIITFKKTLSVVWNNTKAFLSRVATLILAMNVIVWFLSNFTITFQYISGEGESVLQTFGRIISPVFYPLGFSNWVLVSSLLAGLVAKEVVVSSIGTFGGIGVGLSLGVLTNLFPNTSAVLSFLVFCLLYFPCFATVAILIKEIGEKWTFIGVGIEFIVAYIVSFVVYSLSLAFEFIGMKVILPIITGLILILTAIAIVRKLIKKGRCNGCQKDCKNC